jgi:hypothetical protein
MYDDFEITIIAEEPPALGANVTIRYGEVTETASFSLAAVRAAVDRLNRALEEVQPPIQELQSASATLFDNLFVGRVFRAFAKMQTLADKENHALRLRIISQLPSLVAVPWEYLYDRDLERWLALQPKLSIVRTLPSAGRRPLPVQGNLRVLVMVASPSDLPALDVEREWANLTQASDLAAIELVRVEPTYEALLDTLRQSPHIFHFVGHGKFDDASQQGLLAFCRADGLADLISAEKLATLLSGCDSLRLVLLNACEGAATGLRSAFAGVAQKLIQQGLPAVLAMQANIIDDHAIRFSQEFYRALADGYHLEAAVGEGRKRINEVAHTWGVPALYSQGVEPFEIAPLSNQQKAARLWQKVQPALGAHIGPAQDHSQPPDEIALKQLHTSLEQISKLDPAHEPARKALERLANIEEATRLYAVVQKYCQTEQWREAYRTLELIQRLVPNFRDAWSLLAQVKAQLEGDPPPLPPGYEQQYQEYQPMLNALKEGRLVPFFGWDVSLLGRPEQTTWAPGQYLPNQEEVARVLAESLGNVAQGATSLPQLSQYTVLLEGKSALYRRLAELYAQPPPPTILHQLFAGLPQRLQAKGFLRDPKRRYVIFTLAFDNLMEQAFAEVGQPFHLFAYRHYTNEDGVQQPARFVHIPPAGTPVEVTSPNDYQGLGDQDNHPVLVKLCGLGASAEPDSVLITEDQFLDYLPTQEIGALLPMTLLNQIKGRNFVFFGYTLRPWHFRLLWQRMRFQKRRLHDKSWAFVSDLSVVEREFWLNQEQITPVVAAPEGVVAYVNQWLKSL